jgi:hypothetical protein
MSAVEELLDRLSEIGATIRPAGDRLILHAGPTAIPAGLVGRIRQAKAQLLWMLQERAALEANVVAPAGCFERIVPRAVSEPCLEKPCAARRGKVEEREDGVFLHFCNECGAWGAHGYGVNLRAGRVGRWYCAAHRPAANGQ